MSKVNKRILRIAGLGVALIALAFGAWWFLSLRSSNTQLNAVKASSNQSSTTTKSTSGFDKTKYSLTDSTSIWVIVNKHHPLNPITYTPSDLTVPSVPLRSPGQDNMKMRAATATALEQMFASAKQAGINLQVASGYRSYSYQQSVYGGYVSSVGQTAADQQSARPGYSEHQTGFAVDIAAANNVCTLDACFANTPEGKWLAANAYQYGFLLRYPQDKEAITGYEYEPWHFRYIGDYLSQELHKQNVETLEEFFNVSGGTTYKPAP
jgi:D-alanyl-D-alanine carboxypeptidase